MKFDADSPFADIVFLDKHPGWSYDDLRNAPDEIVMGLQMLDEKRA